MRLIDAEKALDNLEEMTWYHLNNDGKLVEGSRSDFISFINYSDAKRSIEDSATVDAVLVVRCKDCKHRDPEDKKCDCGGLARQGCPFPVTDDYFCSYGEWKDRAQMDE